MQVVASVLAPFVHFDVSERLDECLVVVDGGDDAALVLLSGGLWVAIQ